MLDPKYAQRLERIVAQPIKKWKQSLTSTQSGGGNLAAFLHACKLETEEALKDFYGGEALTKILDEIAKLSP